MQPLSQVLPPPNHALAPTQYCKGGANGKICKTLHTDRTSLNDYFKSLKVDDGYTSLKQIHYNPYNNFPALGRKETNKTTDTDPEHTEDQDSDDDYNEDEESDNTGTPPDPIEQTHTAKTTQPNPKEPTEMTPEEEVSLVESMVESLVESLVEPPKDTTHDNPDHTPLPPTTETPEGEVIDNWDDEDTPADNIKDKTPLPPTKQTPEDTPANKTTDQTPLPTTEQTPEDEDSDPQDPPNNPPSHKVKGCSVSMKTMLKPPSIRLQSTSTSPNQSLLPLSQNTPFTPSPSSKTTQGLRHLEFPMVRHMTGSYQYTDEELKSYVVEAIKLAEITYKVRNDDLEESPELSESVLKGCKESVNDNGKKSKYNKLMDRVTKISRDPIIRAEAGNKVEGKKKGRLASESDMTERASNPKTNRKFSPKMK